MTAREQIAAAPAPVVHPLEGEKAVRFKARSMLIPSPGQVRDAIAGIPYGSRKTLLQLRREMASDTGADVTCPWAAKMCWRLVADAAEEDRAEGSADVTPWWRVTRDGNPDPKMPGGAENHRALLAVEMSDT